MLGMLNALEHYNFSTSDTKSTNRSRTALNQHRVIEAMKYGFAARTEIGDVRIEENAKHHRERIDYFSSKSWGEEVYANITDVRVARGLLDPGSINLNLRFPFRILRTLLRTIIPCLMFLSTLAPPTCL
jgi:gamma-glutamyltranspeptidase